MTARLSGKVALVTGGSRGIGRGIALRLAAGGAKVAVNFVVNETAANEVVAAIHAAGGSAVSVQADVGEIDQGQRCVAEAVAAFGRVDILVNNAGRRAAVHPTLADTSPADYDSVFALNTRGLFFITQAAVAAMPDGARIINISSASSTRKVAPGQSMYAGSKAAVEAFTRIWAGELAPRGITVNAVLPGAVATDLFMGHRADAPDEIARIRAQIPMGRLGRPDDIADVVAFLASDDARWLTGLTIMATGGA